MQESQRKLEKRTQKNLKRKLKSISKIHKLSFVKGNLLRMNVVYLKAIELLSFHSYCAYFCLFLKSSFLLAQNNSLLLKVFLIQKWRSVERDVGYMCDVYCHFPFLLFLTAQFFRRTMGIFTVKLFEPLQAR